MDFFALRELENKHALKTANRQNICFISGQGNRLFDTNGRDYLDLVCSHGENCLGYGNGELSSALESQVQKLMSIPRQYYSPHYGQVLSKLLNGTGFTKACFTGSGAEAVFTSLTLLKSYLEKTNDTRNRIVVASGRGLNLGIGGFNFELGDKSNADDSRKNKFGNTGKISKGDGENGNKNSELWTTIVPVGDFTALKKALTPDTAVLVITPIETRNIKIMDYDYLVNAYALCKSMDILLFCDETRIGIGRTGTKLACENYGIQPDILALSRGLGGGLNAGAVLTRDNIASALKTGAFRTHEQNQLSCVAADVVLSSLEGGALTDIAEKGEYLLSRLYKLTKHNFVVDVRGKGLLAAVELSDKIQAAKVVIQMEKNGVLITSTENNVLRLSPSFTITHEEIDEGVDALAKLFAETNI